MIDALEALRSSADKRPIEKWPVRYDFCDTTPRKVGSYRGYYEDLALGWAPTGRDALDHGLSETAHITVGALLILLKCALGETFTGYKGGDYTMTRGTTVWVANYGEASGTSVQSIEQRSSEVVIHTAYDRD